MPDNADLAASVSNKSMIHNGLMRTSVPVMVTRAEPLLNPSMAIFLIAIFL